MSVYTQLTQEQRYQIYAFLKAGFLQSAIAKQIGVNKSTISHGEYTLFSANIFVGLRA